MRNRTFAFFAASAFAVLATAASACGGSNAATQGGARTAYAAPTWFAAPPKSPSKLYFVGDATDAGDEGTARDLAVQKAIAQLTVYCGASIKSDARSEERETNGKHEILVSMTVDVAGDELTVREAVVRETHVGKGSDGRFDAYALLEWPKEQYEAVLAMQRERAARALSMFLDADKASRDFDTIAARTSLKDAKAILGPMKSAVPLQHAEYKNTSLLWDAMTALGGRLDALEKEKKNVFAVVVECMRDGKPSNCASSRAGALRQILSKTGRKVSADAVPSRVATDILSSESPTADKSVRSAGYVVAVRYSAELQAIDGPFTFVRCGARGVVYDTATGRIVGVQEIAPEKEGHPNYEGAMEKGFTNAEKQLLRWIEAEVPKLK